MYTKKAKFSSSKSKQDYVKHIFLIEYNSDSKYDPEIVLDIRIGYASQSYWVQRTVFDRVLVLETKALYAIGMQLLMEAITRGNEKHVS